MFEYTLQEFFEILVNAIKNKKHLQDYVLGLLTHNLIISSCSPKVYQNIDQKKDSKCSDQADDKPFVLTIPTTFSNLETIGKANAAWMPAVTRGRKKTIRIWEWMLLRISSRESPTFCMISNRLASCSPSEICL